MPSVEDWVNNPLGIIQSLFDKHKNFDSANVEKYFADKLKAKNAMTWIPSLNDNGLHTLKPNTLVRFRCIVQDMYDPEFYLGAYQVEDAATGNTFIRSGKYKDVAECGANQTIDVESLNNKTMDRMTLYCVPVPGEAEWVKKVSADQCKVKTRCYPSTSKPPARCKRNFEEDTMETQEGQGQSDSGQGQSDFGQGQSSANGGADDVSMETEAGGEMKRLQTTKTEAGPSKCPDLNFPLPGETGPACLIKVYEGMDSFKVNDIVEFVGVLSVDPTLARFHTDSTDDDGIMGVVEETEEELQAHAPPPSLVPRLHAVYCEHLKHINPLVPPTADEDYKSVMENSRLEVQALREELLSILEHALLGDRLAAEYLLCHLIASVYGRVDAMPLGKFCINLSNTPATPAYADLLHYLMSNLVTQSHILHMSLDNMNKMSFSPRKDYKANRLCSGILQLADQTNLVLNETALQPGQLDVNGVKNLSALGNMINWQKVEYDFVYHRQDFLSNVLALILSEGKSILPSDSLIPLEKRTSPDNLREHFTLLDTRLTEDFLTKCRTYLGLARNMEYSLTDDVQKKIQDDFVEMRKEDPKSMTIDDFHTLLSLTRLLALSELKACPTSEIWGRAKTLENNRRQRVSQIPPRQQAT